MKLRPQDLDAFPHEDLDLIQGHLDRQLPPRDDMRARKLLVANPAYRKLLELLRGLDILSRRPPAPRASFASFSGTSLRGLEPVQEMSLSSELRSPSVSDVPAPPADWRSRAAMLDPPLRQVPMTVSPEHAELLDEPFELDCDPDVFDETELDILDEYGRLMQALTAREVRPQTKDEHRFYRTCVADVPPSSDEERVWTKYLRHRAGDAGDPEL